VIPYIDRTRHYYSTLGYPAYSWAENAQSPFQKPAKPVNQSRLALITTAAPFRADLADQGPGAAYNADAKFFTVYTVPADPAPDLRISHRGYDRKHTTAEDPATWLPIKALQQAVADGRLGSLADNLIGVPTNRSQRTTIEVDAEAALDHCIAQQVDLALLVPS
jgi:hypothetical protein